MGFQQKKTSVIIIMGLGGVLSTRVNLAEVAEGMKERAKGVSWRG